MKPWIKWTTAALVLVLLSTGTVRTLWARKNKQAALAAQQTAQKTEVSVALTASDVVSAKTLDLTQSLALTGFIQAVHSVMVKARTPGELNLTLREGDTVKAGQIVAHVDATDAQARLHQAKQQAQAAQAQVDMAKRSHDNNLALLAQGFISSTALQNSQATFNAALANLAAAQAGVDLAAKAMDDTVLRSPISGTVSQRLAQNGERVAVESRILEIVDISQLEMEAALSASDSVWVKAGQTAMVHVEGIADPFTAKVARINPSTSIGSRAVLVYLTLNTKDSPAHLRQGLFAQGDLTLGTVRTLASPLSAVRTDKAQPYVQVIAQGRVMHQTVTLGERGVANGQIMVGITGVHEGSVLIDGTVGTLRAGTQVQTVPLQ
jgi:RND family efflux transporter MFP subunit